MEGNKYTAPVSEMIPVIKTAIENNRPVEITVTGNSMMPLLKDRISSVRLTNPNNLKRGDIILFLRNHSHYVLHRIISVHNDLYDVSGDNQYDIDKNISIDCIIAKVSSYSRDGIHWKDNDNIYRLILPVIKNIRRYKNGLKRRLTLFVKH